VCLAVQVALSLFLGLAVLNRMSSPPAEVRILLVLTSPYLQCVILSSSLNAATTTAPLLLSILFTCPHTQPRDDIKKPTTYAVREVEEVRYGIKMV
jgi:hypothetical protein